MTAAIYATVWMDGRCELILELLRRYAARSQSDTIEYLEKISATEGGRFPVLGQLLADARLKKFDTVLVWKMDGFVHSVQELIARLTASKSAEWSS